MTFILIILQVVSSGGYWQTEAVMTDYKQHNEGVMRGDRGHGGGPDDWGYIWLDSDTTATGAPTYTWVEIKGIGTEITGVGDDAVAGPFSIGFDFPYYWYTVNSFYLGSNGYIAFGDNFMDAHPFPNIPSTARPNNLVAPLMCDLDPSVGTNPTIWYWTNAAMDTCIVQWDSVRFYESTTGRGMNTLQIILSRPDSCLTFQYKVRVGDPEVGDTRNDCSVGMENVSGTIGLMYYRNDPELGYLPHADLAIRFISPDSGGIEVHDLSVEKVMNDNNSGFFLLEDSTVNFWALVKNTGNQPETDIPVECVVIDASNDTVFIDSITIASSAAGQRDSLLFEPTWTATPLGTYAINVKCDLSGDMTPANDTKNCMMKIVNFPVELYYDIGFPQSGVAWTGSDGGMGCKFTPPGYTASISQFKIYLSVVAAPTNVTFMILDDDGPGGYPGTILFEETRSGLFAGWTIVDIPDSVHIREGAFYVGGRTDAESDPQWAMDTIPPYGRQTWEYTGGWSPYRDLMTEDALMRAYVSYGGDPGVEEGEWIAPQHSAVNITASPNPFNMLTAITAHPNSKSMKIYDVGGRLVRNLKIENGIANWNGCNDAGKKLSQGIYFGMFDNDQDNQVIKLILVK
ncbi:hypothetical protein AMJ52_09620 [candidate division TA06 bacterium DG_78]|uniref:Secretion system C-terminal sorting domain-containing protein n=1 Tax=candidate division TA06 bacterium DG_78 TaxID=1703772 RepID=A0A0S7Y7I8_UNCT6|nr:MAG: hypothetical protein AMJ52_09620 [candidate division TA06 bacterium DG_78]